MAFTDPPTNKFPVPGIGLPCNWFLRGGYVCTKEMFAEAPLSVHPLTRRVHTSDTSIVGSLGCTADKNGYLMMAQPSLPSDVVFSPLSGIAFTGQKTLADPLGVAGGLITCSDPRKAPDGTKCVGNILFYDPEALNTNAP